MVILYQAWRYFPFSFLFILARLQALPGELDEAARVDGATPLQRFWRITLPQLQGVIALLTVLRFIWTFNEFDDIYLLTQGGAGTEVVSVRVFHYLTGGQGFLVFLRNSAVISVSSVVVTLGVSVLGAYAIARLEFFGRRQVHYLFLVENRQNWTVSLGLSQLAGSIEVSKTTLMAGSVILTLPIIVLFFATERLLVEGLTSGAEKG